MRELKQVRLSSLHHNPHRQMDNYPLIQSKIDTLCRSIEDVGLWEGIIARPAKSGYQIAFGHHRVAAAKQAGLTTVSIIVRDLSDEQMLQFMGRENGEDYKSLFLIMLNTWEAAVEFGDHGRQNVQPLDIAAVLGWTSVTSGRAKANQTALACSAAHTLLTEGHIEREDLEGLSVKDAREICQHAVNRMKQITKLAKTTGRPAAEVEVAKKQIAKGAKHVAKKASGDKSLVLTKDIRGEADLATYRFSKESNKQTPLFSAFANNLMGQLNKTLSEDSASKKLQAIVDNIDAVELEVDRRAVKLVDYELAKVSERANGWRSRLNGGKKVVPLKAIEGGAK